MLFSRATFCFNMQTGTRRDGFNQVLTGPQRQDGTKRSKGAEVAAKEVIMTDLER